MTDPGEPADRETGGVPARSSGEDPPLIVLRLPPLWRISDQQTSSTASAGSEDPRSPVDDGASPPSSSLPLTSDELDELVDGLDDVLEHDELLDDLDRRDELTAHRARIDAERRGWTGP